METNTARETRKTMTDAAINYRNKRKAHWDTIARRMDTWTSWGRYYHERLEQVYKFLIPPGQKVLEIGCGRGDLLAALKPETGAGIDFSGEMISRAKKRHPELRFIQADAHDTGLKERFDTIILSDLVNDLWDVQEVFNQVKELSTPRTRIIINTYSRVWEIPLFLAQLLGLANPKLPQNWLTVEDISGMLDLAGLEVIRTWPEILWPLDTPLVADFLNRSVTRLWPFYYLCLTNFIIARPKPTRPRGRKPVVSVIVPARNEADNIPQIFKCTSEIGGSTELIFVEGHSRDDTY